MNVFLQKLFLGLLFLWAVPLTGLAQEVELETYRGSALEYVFASHPYNPSVFSRPRHGELLDILNLGQDNYQVTYVPDADYVGVDEFKITVWSGGGWEIRKVSVTVLPSKVDAHPDLAHTYLNTPIDVDVLFNDEGSSGGLFLKSILLVNNGDAQLSDGGQTVTFIPSEDFDGLAQFNYVVCDEYGSCDQGTATISVLGEPTAAPDTMRIFTKKNLPQSILIPKAFPLTVPPANGSYDTETDLPTYTPAPDFTGTDYMEFADGDMIKVVEITVLDVKNNLFAYDDDVYTTSFDAVEFNVLNNDFYGASSGCLTPEQPEFGTVRKNSWPNGSMTYIPSEGFQGIDRFTYSVQPPDCEGEAETATVYVYVSNFEPAYSKFKMVTPKRTPLIIGYNVPIRNFEFEVSDQAELGKAMFLDGRVDTTIYGQRVQGYNIILYQPGEKVDSGTDEFEIEYCVTKNGDCQFRKYVKIEVDILDIGDGSEPMCFDDCIWAGDTNFDGIVNVEDILPLGVYMGKVGTPREDFNLDLWYGQYGDDWGEDVQDVDDLKHVDTNGDSLITGMDTMAISRFYGNTHAISPARVPDSKYTIELQGDVFVNPGETLELDMVLGKAEQPAVDVYGFTFPLEYNPDFFIPESVQLNYDSRSWLAYGSPVLFMNKNNGDGLLESGFTRTNGLPATGLGSIGKVRIVVDDIAGFRPEDEEVTVDIGGGVATVLGPNGQVYGAEIATLTIHINLKGDQDDDEARKDPATAERLLKVFPNPTRDFLNVHFDGGGEFQRLWLHNLAGQQVFDSGMLQNQTKRINVSNFRNGIYFLSVLTENGVIRKKIEVIR